MTKDFVPTGEVVIFIREDGFYPIQLSGLKPTHIEAADHANCNPGTLRIEDTDGNAIWPERNQTMTDLREQVARAMCAHEGLDPDEPVYVGPRKGDIPRWQTREFGGRATAVLALPALSEAATRERALVEALNGLSFAAYDYAGNYLSDDRHDPSPGMPPNYHARIVALFEAIEKADKALASLKGTSDAG